MIIPEQINIDPFKLIGSDWMLITAGNISSFNTMTAAWGGLGHLWNRNVAYIFVRPTRYTYLFLEENEFFTICFFNEKYRDILNICGSTSGRSTNKIRETGLIPLETDTKNIYFQQAELMFECRKIYADDIKPQLFLNKDIISFYPKQDYHRLYIGEIINTINNKNK